MKKICIFLLGLVCIFFDTNSLYRLKELPKLSTFKKRYEFSDKAKEIIKSIHAEESALSDEKKKERMKSILQQENEFDDQKKKDRMTSFIKDKVNHIVQEHPGEGNLYVYNENSGNGIWFNKELVAMSSVLKNAAEEVAVDKNTEIPTRASIQVIQTFSQILSQCAASKSKVEYPNIIRKQIKKLNFADLLSVFKLAHFFETQKNIFKALTLATREKMIRLFKDGISLAENDFVVLQNITSNDEGKELFPDTMFKTLLEKIKKYIRQQFLRNKFTNEKIFYKTNAAVIRGYDVSNLSLNKDASRLLYTTSERGFPEFLSLYACNRNPLSQLFTTPRITLKRPCWLDKKTITYIEFTASTQNQNYTLILHDCVTNQDTKKFMNVIQQTGIENFKPLELLCSEGRVMFSYISGPHDDLKYGVGIYYPQEGFIKHTSLSLSGVIKLLPIKKDLETKRDIFSCACYDPLSQKVSLYKGEIRNNFVDNVNIDKIMDIVLSKDTVLAEDIFSRGIINRDGSKMAFMIGSEVCLLSFNNFKIDRFQCEGVNKISALAFSPDDELLMIAGDKEVIVFDLIEKKIIHEFVAKNAEAFDKNDSIAFSSNGAYFAIGGHSEMRDEFLMMTSLKYDQDLKKLYLNVVNEMAENIKSIPFGERVFLYLLALRSNPEKLEPLTDVEKVIFQSFDEGIQEMLTGIGYVAPEQESEEPAKQRKVVEQPQIPTIIPQRQQSWWEGFWNTLMKYFPQSG